MNSIREEKDEASIVKRGDKSREKLLQKGQSIVSYTFRHPHCSHVVWTHVCSWFCYLLPIYKKMGETESERARQSAFGSIFLSFIWRKDRLYPIL